MPLTVLVKPFSNLWILLANAGTLLCQSLLHMSSCELSAGQLAICMAVSCALLLAISFNKRVKLSGLTRVAFTKFNSKRVELQTCEESSLQEYVSLAELCVVLYFHRTLASRIWCQPIITKSNSLTFGQGIWMGWNVCLVRCWAAAFSSGPPPWSCLTTFQNDKLLRRIGTLNRPNAIAEVYGSQGTQLALAEGHQVLNAKPADQKDCSPSYLHLRGENLLCDQSFL